MKMRVDSNLSPELEELVRQVIGAAIEVHKQLGPGFIEKIYEQALCHELALRGISFMRSTNIHIGLIINFNVKQLKLGIKRMVL